MNSNCPVCSAATNDSKACTACKSFYSRNKTTASLPCIKNTYDCELTLENRAKCRGCRLKKCHASIASNSPVPNLKRASTNEREDEETKRARGLAIDLRPAPPAPVIHGGHGGHGGVRIGGIPRQPLVGNARIPPPAHLVVNRPPHPEIPQNYAEAIIVLDQILPIDTSFAATVASITDRPDILTYAMNITENHMTKWGRPFFTTHPAYQVNAQPQYVMCLGVCLCSLLDMTWAILNKTVGYEYALDDESKRVTPMELAVYGNELTISAYNRVLDLVRTTGFSRLDYTFYRYLAFYDPNVLPLNEAYRNWNMKVFNSYYLATESLDIGSNTTAKMTDTMNIFGMFLEISQINLAYCKNNKPSLNYETYPLHYLAIARRKHQLDEREEARRQRRILLARERLGLY